MTLAVPTTHRSESEHRRLMANAINALNNGQIEATNTITLTISVASTVFTDFRCGANSVISLTPTTANASAEIGAGTIYVSSRGKNTYTLTHANNANADRTFLVTILGN